MYRHEPDGRDYFVYRELTTVGKSLNNRPWYTGSIQSSPQQRSLHSSPHRPRTASPQPERLRPSSRTMQQIRTIVPDRLKEIEESLHALDMEDWRSDRLMTEHALHPKGDRLHDTQESKFSSLSDFSMGTQLKHGDHHALVRAPERSYEARNMTYDHLRTTNEYGFAAQHREIYSRDLATRETYSRDGRDHYSREINVKDALADGGGGSRFENWKSTGDYRLDFESLVNRSLSPPRHRHDRQPTKHHGYDDPDRLGLRYPLVRTPRGRLPHNPTRGSEYPAPDRQISHLGGFAPNGGPRGAMADSDFDISASPSVISRLRGEPYGSPSRTSFRPGALQPAPAPGLSLNLAAVDVAERPARRLSSEWAALEGGTAPAHRPRGRSSSPPDRGNGSLAAGFAGGVPRGRQTVQGPERDSGVDHGSGTVSPPSLLSESRAELAQQLLDQMLGQYFSKAKTFRALMASARGGEHGDGRARVGWLEWWMQLEKEVRLTIKPEMKAVYDTRCKELFLRAKLHLRAVFDRHGDGEERALTVSRVRELADQDIWALYASHDQALQPGQGGRLSWQRFWEDSEPLLKAAVKEHIKQLVKQEMTVKFTQWRRQLHSIFRSVDSANRGTVEAAALAAALQASPLGLVLALPAPEREGLV